MQCYWCKRDFEVSKYDKKRKFCSKSCATSDRNTKCSLVESWKRKHGDAWEIRYEEWRRKMSAVTSGDRNPMHGKHDHVHGLQRFAKQRIGKSLEEIHGVELATELRHKLSVAASGERNPSYEKQTCGGRSVKGYYKGLFFRSLLEYSFMKHLESENVDLHNDVDYECFQVSYEFDGHKRTYRPDFYVKSRAIVYEVKPAYVLKKVQPLQEAKWNAMRVMLEKQAIQFCVITESQFQKIEFEIARQDQDVLWKENTFEFFRKTR